MSPLAHYEARLRDRLDALAEVRRRSNQISLARVLSFLLGASSLGAHLFSHAPGSLPVGLALIGVFVALVLWHTRVARQEAQLEAAVLFCERGKLRAANADGLPARGERLRAQEHPYAADLDLFGKRSVLERLDAMETELSEERLGAWLSRPAPPEQVRARQAAARELAAMPELREALFVHARSVATKNPDLPGFVAWCSSPPPGSLAGPTAMGLLLPPLTALLFFAGPLLGLPPWAWVASAALQWVLTFGLGARGGNGLEIASRGAMALGAFGGVIDRLRGVAYQSPELAGVAQRLDRAGRALARLETLASWAEARENGLFRLMVGPLVMYDLHLWLALERWRAAHGPEVAGWLDALADALAFAGVGTFAHDNPEFCFPEIADGPLCFEAEGLVHPLLPRGNRVPNDIRFGGPGTALLVTGSNMAGKSTLLRSVGVAAVLAQAGAPVAARACRLSPLEVRTSIRISDSLASGYSHFYAELLALKRVVVDSARLPVLFLLDEILHGTNSHERQVGARAVARYLLEQGAMGIITTHDLGLIDLLDELPGKVRPVHLLEQHEGDQMTFDYKLREGVLRSGNALALMRSLGLPV